MLLNVIEAFKDFWCSNHPVQEYGKYFEEVQMNITTFRKPLKVKLHMMCKLHLQHWLL